MSASQYPSNNGEGYLPPEVINKQADATQIEWEEVRRDNKNHELAIQYETQTLGAFMHKPELIDQTILTPEDFAQPAIRLAFQSMKEVSASSTPVDVITVAEALEKSTGKNYLPILADAMQNCVSPNNAKTYARQVKERSIARKAMEISKNLARRMSDGPAAIDDAIAQLMELNAGKANHECSLKVAVKDAINRVDYLHENDGVIPGVSTGLVEIDNITGGFQPGDLYIVAGRPSMGKTAMMLNMTLSADVPCGIFSAEQPRLQIGSRMLAIRGEINAARLRNGALQDSEWPKLTSAVSQLHGLPIRIYDRPAPTILDLVRQARVWRHHYGIQILFVDYLQRIGGMDRRASRTERVGQVAMGLKELARTLDIPVVALAQISRKVEERPNKRPTMSDLKDSGEIEQEADTIMTIYRDEVYNHDTTSPGVAEIDLPKNRHGPVGMAEVDWQAWCMRFNNLSMDQQATRVI